MEDNFESLVERIDRNIMKQTVCAMVTNNLIHRDDLNTIKEMVYNTISEKLYNDDIADSQKIEERFFKFIVDYNIPTNVLGNINDNEITVHEAIEETIEYMLGENFNNYAHACIEMINDDTFSDDIIHKTKISIHNFI